LTASKEDLRWLDSAVRLARPQLGSTGPFPTAAAIIVDGEQTIAGRGVTGPGGEPAAVARALAEAGVFAEDATLYVTIEPDPAGCAAAIEARIARVVLGMKDPANPGVGAATLREAHVEVELAGHAASAGLHEAYATRVNRQRPFTNVFVALSRDGMVGRKDGLPTILLGEPARRWLALQRLAADAVVSGLHPESDLRLDGGAQRHPLKVVLVGTRQPPASTAGPRVMFALPRRALALQRSGSEIVEVDGRSGRPDVRLVAGELARRGISALHVQAGPRLTESFIAAEVVDRVHVLRTPLEIGRGGIPATAMGTIEARLRAAGFEEKETTTIGDDCVTTLDRRG
jgi:diaminohydroxyphosphoribosylaminopyrimidine deaminase/5-amino-6-(5-phosphoribosylamino)uracil reductase